MFSARIFIVLVLLISYGYESILVKIADEQRKKPLPEEVADVYAPERYQTYLDYVADSKKIKNKYKLINIVIDTILIFSPIYHYIDEICRQNPYLVFLLTYAIIWIIGVIIGTCTHYEITFGLMEKYGLNKKDKKEFIKDEVLDNVLEIFLMVCLGEMLVYLGEHMATWTNNFSIGIIKSGLLIAAVFLAIYAFFCVAKLVSYAVLRKQYTFTPLEEGELRDKINQLQESSKKKVKHIYVYNESKKSTTKNAFLLKLFWHREFGIADNFMNENAQGELLAVLSHEIGHLKHKKNLLNYMSYVIRAIAILAVVYIVINPSVLLMVTKWIRDSFDITANSYYLIILVLGDIFTPLSFMSKVFNSYRSKCEEYEADREAVKNHYGEELIRTFKTLSSDELVNVNPHPFIEFTEYDHPGMYQRIKAINNEIKKVEAQS